MFCHAGQALLIKLGLGKGYDQVVGYGYIEVGTYTRRSGLQELQWYSFLEEGTRLNWKGIGLEVGASVLADVALQVWYDSQDPFLTTEQFAWRVGIAGLGGALSGGTGILASPGGPLASFAASTAVELVWQYVLTPIIYQTGGLVGERRLFPLNGGN